jgi:hypothetical protein
MESVLKEVGEDRINTGIDIFITNKYLPQSRREFEVGKKIARRHEVNCKSGDVEENKSRVHAQTGIGKLVLGRRTELDSRGSAS